MKMLFTIDEIGKALELDEEAARKMLTDVGVKIDDSGMWIARDCLIELLNRRNGKAKKLLAIMQDMATDLMF